MNLSRSLGGSLCTLRRQGMRSAFIMAGSLLGAAALTFVLTVGEGAQRKMLSTVEQLFGDSFVLVMAGGQQLMSGPRADAARLTIDDIEAVASALPEIEVWDPQQVLASSIRRGNTAVPARVLGQSEKSERVWSRTVSRGRFFDAGEVRRLERVALVGETVAQGLFGDADPVGAEILVDSVPFTVVGVLERFGTDLHGMDRDNEVVVPVTTLLRRLSNMDTISAAKLLVRNPRQVGETAHKIRAVLRERHVLASGQADDFALLTPMEVQQMVGRVRGVLTLYLPLASVVVLLVAGMVAATLMLGSVNARISEIGLRRAVGAQPGDIARQFVVETTVTMLGGALLGILLGLLAAVLVGTHLKLGVVFSPWTIVLVLGLSAATGTVAGVLPARRAARLLPVDALR